MNMIISLVCMVFALFLLGWMGLHIKPNAFSAYPQQPMALKTISLPQDLPAPVKRFHLQIYGENVPVIESAVISGRASLRLKGITFPGRFRFTHQAGKDYRHYIEVTLFGFPLMKINESYLDRKGRMELPFGVTENNPKLDQAANLGLWSESIWFPSIWVTDSRVHWKTIDDHTALLVVPFGEGTEQLIMRFSSQSGLPDFLESMRYKDPADDEKTLWLNRGLKWNTFNGWTTLSIGALTWFDDGLPWAIFDVDDILYYSDVREYVRAKGL